MAALDFLQVALQLLLGPLQLLDGEPLAAALLDLADALGDLEYLVLDDLPLPLRADRDLLELRVADDAILAFMGSSPQLSDCRPADSSNGFSGTLIRSPSVPAVVKD